MDKQSLIRLFDYHYWANRRLWDSIVALSDQEFTRAQSDGRPSVRALCVRMVANENLWVNYLWHGGIEFLKEEQLPTRELIRYEWDALEEEIRDFLDELSHADLQREVEPPFLNSRARLKVSEILLQITHHGAEGRAQLCLLLDSLGTPAHAQDFIGFLIGQEAYLPA